MGQERRGTSVGMLGRDEELAELDSALSDALAGRCRVKLVAGEPGIGKTTLVRALVQLTPSEVGVRWGRCWEAGGAPAFWPWLQVLQELADHAPEPPPEVLSLLPEAGDHAAPTPRPADTQAARFRMFEAVTDFLKGASRHRGLVLILEDLHAADEASLQLLRFVAREVHEARLLVLGTFRDTEVRTSPTAGPLLAAVAREGRTLTLRGLAEPAVTALAEATAATRLDPQLLRDIRDTTEGNPLFIQEMSRMLAAERRTAGTTRPRLPEQVRDVIRRRLVVLPGDMREVLSVAAVVGKEFSLAALEAVTESSRTRLLDTLGDAEAAGVVEELGLGRWSFTHSLLQETLYEDVPKSRRVVLHGQIGELLERLHQADLSPVVAEIAQHFFEASRRGDAERAVHYCVLAGDQASRVLALEEAARWYGRALEALDFIPNADLPRRYEVLMARADAVSRGGFKPEARALFEQAAEMARRLQSPKRLAPAALGFAGISGEEFAGGWQQRRALLEEALAAMPDEDSPLRARLLCALAPYAGQDRQRVAREAVDMARRVAEGADLLHVLLAWHQINGGVYGLDERLSIADELVRLAREQDDTEALALALQRRAADRFEAGLTAGMRADLERGVGEATKYRLTFVLYLLSFNRAALALLEGRFEDAERHRLEALEHGRRSGFAIAEWTVLMQLMMLQREQGRFEDMADECQRVMAMQEWTHTPRLLEPLTLIWTGREHEARRLYRELQDQHFFPTGCGPTVDWWTRLVQPALLAETAFTLGETTRAEELYDALLPWSGLHVKHGVAMFSLGSSDRYLGLLATLLGQFEAADAHFQASHELHERIGAWCWLAHGQVDHARMLRARQGPGDVARATQLLAAARDRYEDLHMKYYQEVAEELLANETTLPVAATSAAMRLDEDSWSLQYGGLLVRLRDSKGLQYLATLLGQPGAEVHALALRGQPVQDWDRELYWRRLTDLREEIEEAEAASDHGRSKQAYAALDQLTAEVAAAFGVGGDSNGAAAAAVERARQSVTRAIKGAIDRVAEAHPALGEHLRATVRTGTYSSYAPDPRMQMRWEIEAPLRSPTSGAVN